MRALCGAIITAGAMVALGLTMIGIGMRYSSYPYYGSENQPQWVKFRHLDSTLMASVIIILCVAAIGLGIAYLGLAYHHFRRSEEMKHYGGTSRERAGVS